MMTRKNILLAKECSKREKAENVSCLKSTLLLSTLRSNKMLADEVHMRSLLKGSTRGRGRGIGSKQDESSTLVISIIVMETANESAMERKSLFSIIWNSDINIFY